jgi:ABC-2 type transport system permease protein
MNEATFDQRRAAIRAGLLVLGFPLVIALGFAVLAYSLSTFFDERKDKSITFWRSLPVSDSFTVFSKLIVALVVAPLLVIPALLFLHLVSVTAGSIYFAVSDIVPFTWAWQAYPWLDWIRVIFSLWLQGLWSLPIITWIMLVGAYSRKPVVAAILPPVVVVLVEGVSLSSSVFLDSLFERVQPWSRASSFPKEYESLGVAELSDIPLLFGMTEFWVGILISSVFIYLTIYFRSKSDYASVE